MNTPNFSGKTVSVSISEDSCNHDLVNPVFETQGGRIFITGRIAKNSTDSGWSDGKVGAIAWDNVTEYVIFDSDEEYQAAIKKSEEFQGETDT